MSSFIPFPADPMSAPLDISYLFEAEKPAGKHGFLRAEGEQFVFEDGTAVRFWGTNLNAGACFPEKDYAPKLAKRLAAYGCNMVRFHQIDAEWGTPNIFQCRKGRRLADTLHTDPESFDRLDWLVYCLKQEGIYIFLDMLTYRKFKAADGVRNSVSLINRAAPYCLFDPQLIELQEDYCRQLWEHVNPYTGLAYKDDPVFALCEPVNEVDLFGCFNHKVEVEPYASEFRELLRAWSKTNAPQLDVDGANLNDVTLEPLNQFKYHLGDRYYARMFAFLRSLGVRVPLTGCNFSWMHTSCKAAAHTGDFLDTHLNMRYMSWSPEKKVFRDVPPHALAEWGVARSARMRRFGKPFFNSEWDLTYPISCRAEGVLLLSAIGMLQNWSGFTIHTYAYTSNLHSGLPLGKEVTAGSIGGVGYREGPFSTWNDPAKFGMFYHAAIITRRGDVSPAKGAVTVAVENVLEDDLRKPENLTHMKKKAFVASSELCRIGTDYWNECPDAVSDRTELVDVSKGEVRSDTNQLYRSWEKGFGTVDTPMTKAVYGALGRAGEVAVDGLRVRCKNPYAVVALSSLNNRLPLDRTDSILLTAQARVENTGFALRSVPDCGCNDGMPPRLEVVDNGTAPILCEVVEAEVALRTDKKDLVVWAVSAEGVFVGNVPVRYEDGWAVFTLGKKSPSVYYLIQSE